MDLQTKLGFAIIILSTFIIAVTLLKQPFKSSVDIVITFVALGVALLVFFYAPAKEHFEGATENPMVKPLNASLTALGAINDSGAENVASFSSGQTIYYSAFSAQSYPRGGRNWFNICPYFASPQSECPNVRIENTHALFSEMPGYSKATGFSLGPNIVTGPMSYQMGISLNDSFTIAFTIQFDSFSSVPPTSNIEIFKMFANTSGNNGLALYIRPDYTPVGTDFNVNMFIEFGDSGPLKIANLPPINTSFVYIIVVSKQGLNLNFNLYPNITDLNSSINNSFTFQIVLPPSDVLLSNKELAINRMGTLQGHIYNWGVWNKALGVSNIAPFYANAQVELQKTNPVLINYAQQFAALNNQLKAANSCPYDASTCSACKGVTQWNNMSDLILNGGSDCMAAIDNYCKNNPNASMCTCWNTSSALSGTSMCMQYKSIYQGADSCAIKNLDDIDTESMNLIQNKYNLCSCPLPAPAEVPVVDKNLLPHPPIPKLISSVYSINQSDIDMYNSIPVGAIPKGTAANIDTSIFQPLLDLIGRG